MGVDAVERSTQLAMPPKQVPAKPKDRAKTEAEKRNTRDWILQYAQEDSDSEDDSKKVCRRSAYLMHQSHCPSSCSGVHIRCTPLKPSM